MIFKLFSALLLNLVCLMSFAQTVEKGITEELAAWRKKEISNVKYQLNFHITGSDESIIAQEEIIFDLNDTKTKAQIDFKINPEQIKKLTVNGKIIKPVYINEHLIIEPYLLLKKNNQVKIDFISPGKSMKRDTSGLVYCLFVPAKARECFACFDQPDLKAGFKLSLAVPHSWLAVSNSAISKHSQEPGETTWEFEETKPISTYLFSFATGKFKLYSETREGRTINFYYRETQQTKIDSSLKQSMDLNFKALAFNINYLESAYPFQKFDFVEIPGFSISGMEHPGAIFYNGNVLFLDKASASQLYERNRTIGHEVSHMWFGDWVTMKWFNEVWLKEVFANYIGDKFANTQSVDSSFNKKFLLGNFPQAYSVDRFPSADPILRKLSNLNQAGLVYGEITYNKAPIMMHQLESLLGEESFKKGVRDYIRLYKGGNADFAQLVKQLKKYSLEDIDSWLNTWVKKAGRPIFYYQLDTAGGIIHNLTLSQYGEYDSSLLWGQKFDVMLFYDSGVTQTIRINMKNRTHEIVEAKGKKAPKFILFNTSGEGYGVFPIDKAFVEQGLRITSVEARAAAVINLYELMLRSKEKEYAGNFLAVHKPGTKEMLNLLCSLVSWEPDRQLLERELRYIGFIYWKLLKPGTRQNTSAMLEKILLDAIPLQTTSNKTAIFRTYIQIAETPLAMDSLFACWNKRLLPKGISFGTSDWSELAMQLALRNYHAEEVLKRELDSLKNYYADHKSFLFKMKALSTSVSERDSFFNSLLTYEGRKEEADVISALYYLHHPLRQTDSRKYIKPSLDILPEILYTNDLFFAPNWISSTLGSYNDDETVRILKLYLSKPHSDVPYLLLQKVRQSADLVFRAEAVAE